MHVVISEIITFRVITLCVKKVITICVERLLHFALKILLHFASMLLHFALALHFAAILFTFCVNITFCGVTEPNEHISVQKIEVSVPTCKRRISDDLSEEDLNSVSLVRKPWEEVRLIMKRNIRGCRTQMLPGFECFASCNPLCSLPFLKMHYNVFET